MAERTYTDPKTGKTYPLEEAETDYKFRVYKSHRRKAVIGDPTSCLIALGLQRDEDIISAHLGSGKDAYVIFKNKGRRPATARHYVILAAAAKVRDAFDQKGAPNSQWLTLSAPTEGRTLEAREKMRKRRARELKEGTGQPYRPRSSSNRPRVTRLGVAHRPKAIVKNNDWTVPVVDAPAQQ